MTGKQIIEIIFWIFIVIGLVLIASLIAEMCGVKIFSDEWLVTLSCLCALAGFIAIEMLK